MMGPHTRPYARSPAARTLLDKIWDEHRIARSAEGDILQVDRHYLHDLGGAPALQALAARGLAVRAPALTLAVADHVLATGPARASTQPEVVARLVDGLAVECRAHGIRYITPDSSEHGIVHVIGPELGLTQPGMLVVCCDSHTCTHGALGALGFGIGSSEVVHVLATQTIVQRKPRQLRVRYAGTCPSGVSAKDLALYTIARLGAAGGTGYALEYTGEAVAALSIEARMTLCNMAVELGAKMALIAPDARTFAWLENRPYMPSGAHSAAARAAWQQLYSDADAVYDREALIEVAALAPQITWGTSPQDAIAIDAPVPTPEHYTQPARQQAVRAALAYMGVRAGAPLRGLPIDRVFIGSCTNARLEDLRAAAQQLRGRRVAAHVRAWVVPGSAALKQQAEAEGLARLFIDAGFDWREAGCSMCLAANGEAAAPGQRVVATSNRNFVGRQGPGVRTHLASPATAAACALAGVICAPEG